MQLIFIRRIAFGSFIKLLILIGFSIGVFMGILMFCLAGILGIGSAELCGTTYHGLTAGILNLFIAPFIFVIFGVLGGVFAYLPFRIVMKVLKKVSIYGKFDRGDIDVE